MVQKRGAMRGFAMGGGGCSKAMQRRIAIGRGAMGGAKVGAKNRGARGGCKTVLQMLHAEGFCNGGGCKSGKQCGIAIGRGAKRGAEMGAKKRGAKGSCKTLMQKWGAMRGFAMGVVATK